MRELEVAWSDGSARRVGRYEDDAEIAGSATPNTEGSCCPVDMSGELTVS